MQEPAPASWQQSGDSGQAIGPPAGVAWWEGTPAAGVVALALDTSTRSGGVALYRDGVVLAEETWQAGGSQTRQVLPAAERQWRRAGLRPTDVGAVVVATGPGSFTGLRVGASLGKGFVAALGIPLIDVPTLDALAYQFRHCRTDVCVVLDAGRAQRYAGWYAQVRQAGGGLRRRGPFQTLSLGELGELLAARRRAPLVAGELGPDGAAALAERLGAAAHLATPAAGLRRPAFLAELGLWRLAGGAVPDPAALQPLYLKRAAP